MKRPDLQFFPELPYLSFDSGMPPRSRLFSLPPIGVGTASAEGLLSYVIRLAKAHSVSPRRLVQEVFIKTYPELAKYRRCGPFFTATTGTDNGLCRFSKIFVEAVEKLCGIDAKPLTMLPLQAMLPFNAQGLFPPRLRWCPACYAEMRGSGGEFYLPLVWFFDHYRICRRHRCTLRDRCPVCSSHQQPLPRSPVIGFCSQCGVWMGRRVGAECPPDAFELWLSSAIGEIVAALPMLEALATRERFVSQVECAITQLAGGSRRLFCLEVGIPELSIQYLLSGDKRPTLSLWLEVAYVVGVGPVALLASPLNNHATHRYLNHHAAASGYCRFHSSSALPVSQ